MSERLVKETKKKIFSRYLENWVIDGPKFGRETRTWFIDHKISGSDLKNIIEGCNARLKLLEKINTDDNLHLIYFRRLEEFCIDFYNAQFNYQKALSEFKAGNIDIAQHLIKQCHPEAAIKKYAEISQINGITKGEKGVIVEMNLSWLPLINSLRQTLRLKPTYLNFDNINFPDLGVGLLNTNYILDKNNKLWRNFGNAKTVVFENDLRTFQKNIKYSEEIVSEGIRDNDSLEVILQPYAVDISPNALKNPAYFISGKYRLTLILAAETDVEFDLFVESLNIKENLHVEKISIKSGKILSIPFSVQINHNDAFKIILKNKNGICLINGAIIEPV